MPCMIYLTTARSFILFMKVPCSCLATVWLLPQNQSQPVLPICSETTTAFHSPIYKTSRYTFVFPFIDAERVRRFSFIYTASFRKLSHMSAADCLVEDT